MKLRIFNIYFGEAPVYGTDALLPIQAGRARTGVDLGMLSDDTGDSISGENLRYGEMTAWYWVWKNYLPAHPELEYVGMSQYRRLLNFAGGGRRSKRTSYSRFVRRYLKCFDESSVLSALGSADLAIREIRDCGSADLREHFRAKRPEVFANWDRFAALMAEREPEFRAEYERILSGTRIVQGLQFVMRRGLFVDFMEWSFGLCRAFERRYGWSAPSSGESARAPAFLIERLFIAWVETRRRSLGLEVKECKLMYLSSRPWWYGLAKPVRMLARLRGGKG